MSGTTKRCAADGCKEAFLASGRQKYCSKRCQKRMSQRRYRRQQAEKEGRDHIRSDAKSIEDQGFEYTSKAESKDGRASFRGGPGYDKFCLTEWPDLISSGDASQADAQRALGETGANISRWMAKWYQDLALGKAREDHEPDLSHTEDLGSFTRRYFPDLLVPDFHLEWEQAIDETVGTGGRLLLLAPQRFGKAIDAEEEILTRERGWVAAIDVRGGDHIPSASGGWTEVLEVHDQGVTDAVEVTFSDGTSIVTNPEHKWSVRQRYYKDKWHTKTSSELADDLWETTTNGHRNAKWRIPIVAPTVGDESMDTFLPIHPYVLGVWLGDGTSSRSEVTSEDPEIIDRVAAVYGEPTYEYKQSNAATYGFTGGFLSDLKRLNLHKNKHIPDAYLQASTEARECLLAGLMDTDGTTNTSSGQVSYCTTSEPLRDGFCELVASLGGVYRIYEKEPWFRNDEGEKVYGKTAYVISVRLPESVQPFQLQRKVDLTPEATSTNGPRRLVHDVSPVARRQTVCFTVDAEDHLFCAGRDYIVTHNSELLIRYCLRRIAQDPNISIGWVSKTADLAERMVGYVRANLEHNDKFVEDVLGHGQTFQPPTRSGLSWTNGEFTVGNRTKIRKAPTMKAIGVGGTIVGLDFDLIILDDPQDRIRCMSPSQREKDIEWLFTDFLSRKEEHTGVAFIMSRQHIDDLPGNVIRDHADDWRIMVYRSHDPACPIPEDEVERHTECVLWPKKRPWSWLFPQKQANEAHFQRNYMNDPKTDNTVLITAKDIDNCKDHERTLGQIPKGVSRLVAGIDPADAKPVAAVLFGFEPASEKFPKGRRHVIDIMEAEAGVRGGREVIRQWKQNHRCSLFVVESNMAQSWWQDQGIRDLTSDGMAQVKQVYTSRVNKWNDATGVVAMFSKMRVDPPEITIPWGDKATQQKMERLARTFLLFDPDYASHKHADDDLPMAAWFPQPTMDMWVQPHTAVAQADYPRTPYVTRLTPYPTRHLESVA